MTDCRHCAGLSGLPVIPDTRVCWDCVQMITHRVMSRGAGRLIRGQSGRTVTWTFLCPHGRTSLVPVGRAWKEDTVKASVLDRHEWQHECGCALVYAGGTR